MRWISVAATTAILAVPSLALAHHSITAAYDRDRAVSFSGRVVRVELVNPHSQIEVELARPDGPPVRWKIETSSPGGLARLGLEKDTLAVGDPVKVIAYPARNGEREGWLSRLETAKRTYDVSFRNRTNPVPTPEPVN